MTLTAQRLLLLCFESANVIFLTLRLLFIIYLCVHACMCVSVHMCTHTCSTRCSCRGQKITCKGWFLPSTMWVWGNLRSVDLKASAFRYFNQLIHVTRKRLFLILVSKAGRFVFVLLLFVLSLILYKVIGRRL